MDLVLGRFADAHIDALSDEELTQYEHLMDAPDPEVFAWLTGEKETPGNYDTAIFRRIRSFHAGGAA